MSLVVRQLDELRSPGMMPEGRTWPDRLIPLVSMDPGWDCVEASTGRVIAWDPEDLDERVSDRTWAAAFREIQPSVEAWLTDWVGSRTQAEVREIEMRTMREDGAYIHIRNLQAMSPGAAGRVRARARLGGRDGRVDGRPVAAARRGRRGLKPARTGASAPVPSRPCG